METTAQIDLSGISPLCDFPFTIISSFDVNSCKQSRGSKCQVFLGNSFDCR